MSDATTSSTRSWKRHFRFRWSLLMALTLTVGVALGMAVRGHYKARAWQLFYAALQEGDIESVERCLTVEPSLVDWCYAEGTPLHIAARSGNCELAALLIDRGANVNGVDQIGATPILYVASYGSPVMLGLLIRKGADVNIRDRHGRTPLHEAIQSAGGASRDGAAGEAAPCCRG